MNPVKHSLSIIFVISSSGPYEIVPFAYCMSVYINMVFIHK